MKTFTLCTLPLLLLPLALEARVFTDDQGRTVEAELVGVRDDSVILSRGRIAARWPIAKLSAGDQEFVRKWQENPPVVSRVTARIWEREGMSGAGPMATDDSPDILKNIPLLKTTEEKSKYRYYDVDLTNESKQDATGLTMAYILYVISPQGTVIPQSASAAIEQIEAGKRETVSTRSVTYTRTKTTSTTFSINRLGGLSTGSSTKRSTERFGGVWVRVYESDGSVVGEAQKLHPEVAKLRPAWTGAAGAKDTKPPEQPTALSNLPSLPDLPIPLNFEELEKILSGLLEKIPTPPGGSAGPPSPPKGPTPPRPPGPPGFPPKR